MTKREIDYADIEFYNKKLSFIRNKVLNGHKVAYIFLILLTIVTEQEENKFIVNKYTFKPFKSSGINYGEYLEAIEVLEMVGIVAVNNRYVNIVDIEQYYYLGGD